eukprot:1546049-Pyramimonas_sp.AAC.1
MGRSESRQHTSEQPILATSGNSRSTPENGSRSGHTSDLSPGPRTLLTWPFFRAVVVAAGGAPTATKNKRTVRWPKWL